MKSTIGIFAAMFSGEKRGNPDRMSIFGSYFVPASIFRVRYPCPTAPHGTKPPYAVRVPTTDERRCCDEHVPSHDLKVTDLIRDLADRHGRKHHRFIVAADST